jgi:hypothetical protein
MHKPEALREHARERGLTATCEAINGHYRAPHFGRNFASRNYG